MTKRVLLLFSLMACRKPTPTADAGPPDGKREVVIYDAAQLPAGEKTSATEAEKLIAQIFPKRVPCSGRQLTPEQARAAGEVEPAVVGAFKGSFTAPHTDETAYLVLAGECGASHAADFGSHWLLVKSGNRVTAPIDVQATSLDGVVDLDEDGESELVIGAGFTNQGITQESVKLVKLHGAKLSEVKDFGQVLDDDCGSGLPSARSKSKTIRAILKKGSPPELTVSPREAPCK